MLAHDLNSIRSLTSNPLKEIHGHFHSLFKLKALEIGFNCPVYGRRFPIATMVKWFRPSSLAGCDGKPMCTAAARIPGIKSKATTGSSVNVAILRGKNPRLGRVPAGRCCFRGWAVGVRNVRSTLLAWRGMHSALLLCLVHHSGCYRSEGCKRA